MPCFGFGWLFFYITRLFYWERNAYLIIYVISSTPIGPAKGRLMAEEKTVEKAEYYKWLDLSQDERSLSNMPLTEDAYSKAGGVSRQTLIKWKGQRTDTDFDLRAYLGENKEAFAKALLQGTKGEKPNSQTLRLIAQLMGDLNEKREGTGKLELTANDRTRIARETINGLRENYQRNGGYCSVCQRPETICIEPVLDTESRDAEGGTMAAVALSARPD